MPVVSVGNPCSKRQYRGDGLWRIRAVNRVPGLFYECLDSSDEPKTKYTSVGLMLVKFEQNLLMLTTLGRHGGRGGGGDKR